MVYCQKIVKAKCKEYIFDNLQLIVAVFKKKKHHQLQKNGSFASTILHFWRVYEISHSCTVYSFL